MSLQQITRKPSDIPIFSLADESQSESPDNGLAEKPPDIPVVNLGGRSQSPSPGNGLAEKPQPARSPLLEVPFGSKLPQREPLRRSPSTRSIREVGREVKDLLHPKRQATSSIGHGQVQRQLSLSVNPKSTKQSKPDFSTPEITGHVFWESREKSDLGSVDVIVLYMCSDTESNSNISTFERRGTFDQTNISKKGGKTDHKPFTVAAPVNSKTTTTPTAVMTWLSDNEMLPSVLPTSHIMGFGLNLSVLNSAIDFNATASSVLEVLHKKRDVGSVKPLVFIGHGYGAVVIQKLLSKKYDDGSFGASLRPWTAAVLLFAPPFRGSTELIKWLSTGLQLKNTSKFTGSLNDGSVQLQDIWKDFEKVTDDPNIFVYVYLSKNAIAAERKYRGSNVLSIERLQKKVDLIETTGLDIADVAKFSGPKDVRFQTIARLILNAVQIRQLHKAAELGDEPALRYLIDQPVDIFNLTNKIQQTALHEAAKHNDQEFIVTLLSFGIVEIDHQDNDKQTALHIALLRNDINSKPILEELLKAGADPWVKDKEDRSPDDISKEAGTEPSIKKLLARPPPVEGPPVQSQQTMTKKYPPPGDGVAACEKIEITATEVFYLPAKGKRSNNRPEKHLSAYMYIDKFIYSNDPVDKIFKSVRRKDFKEKAFCRWYHIPANNMQWVEDLFVKLGLQIPPWPSRYRDDRLPYSRCMNPQVSLLQNTESNPDYQEALAILIPYISYEEVEQQQKVSRLIRKTFRQQRYLEKLTKFTNTGKARPGNSTEISEAGQIHRGGDNGSTKRSKNLSIIITDEENPPDDESVFDSETDAALNNGSTRHSLDTILTGSHIDEGDDLDVNEIKLLISAYLTHNPPLHPRRTLDQSYYHMLPDTIARDKDQVVSRRAKKEIREMRKEQQTPQHVRVELPSSHNVIMVDQLWLWYIPNCQDSGTDIIVTSFPSREGVQVRKSRDVDDLQAAVLGRQNLHQRSLISNSTELVSRILAVCCRGLDRHQNVKTVEFLQMFQNTIGDAEERETKLFADFRKITKELYGLHEDHPKYQKYRSRKLKDLLDIHKESNALKEIKDVLDEIKMIKAVITDQLSVFSSDILSSIVRNPGVRGPGGRYINLANEAKTIAENAKHNFDSMETHAKDVDKGLDHLLQLKQMQANLWEARSSREGAEETAKQGNTLIVFTVVTILFLPLSFMASFFALGIDQFPHDGQGNTAWDLKFVCALVFGMSFGVSIILLILAFNIDFFFTNPWNHVSNIWLKRIALQLVRPLKHTRILKFRTKGYSWWVKLSKSLYDHEASSATTMDERHQKRVRWLEGLTWNINDGKHWSMLDFPDIYYEQIQESDSEDEDSFLGPTWSSDFDAAFDAMLYEVNNGRGARFGDLRIKCDRLGLPFVF